MIFRNRTGLPDGPRYKGNLHSHTTLSDGHLSPEEAAELFRSRGYHFLCLSEHDRYTDHTRTLNRPDFLILPGLEASAMLVDRQRHMRLKVHHMHGILGTSAMQAAAPRRFSHGQTLPPTVYEGQWDGAAAAQQLADTLREHGCLVTYNHPVWSRVEPWEFKDLEGVWALEIYNYNTVNESGTGADTTSWDLILRSGRQIFAFASDDNHNEGLFDDACGGWIQAAAPELSHDALIGAMLRGDFYSSAGPEIYGWGVENDRVWVTCSACERVNFICGGFVGAGTTVIAPTRDGLRRAEFALTGAERYVRVECVDYAGKFAWTNAIFLEREEA
jgi:hypothetical protein